MFSKNLNFQINFFNFIIEIKKKSKERKENDINIFFFKNFG